MSVNIYFYIEAKDAEGKWHLVKWYSNGVFDKEDPVEGVDQERVVEIEGKRQIEHRETCPGLAWRDELGWNRDLGSSRIFSGLPDDIDEELLGYLKKEFDKEITSYKKYHSEEHDYEPKFGSKYGYIYLSDMFKICDEKREEWIKNIKERLRDAQLDEIHKSIKRLEKKIDGKTIKAPKNDEQHPSYDDLFDYYLGDAFWDVQSLYEETEELMEKARMFTGDRWFESENVRAIYYFC